MIAQTAFESFVERVLTDRDTLSLNLEELRTKGWEVDFLRELVAEYMALPAGSRRFNLDYSEPITGPVVVCSRSAVVPA